MSAVDDLLRLVVAALDAAARLRDIPHRPIMVALSATVRRPARSAATALEWARALAADLSAAMDAEEPRAVVYDPTDPLYAAHLAVALLLRDAWTVESIRRLRATFARIATTRLH
jgi:hypothetical protein